MKNYNPTNNNNIHLHSLLLQSTSITLLLLTYTYHYSHVCRDVGNRNMKTFAGTDQWIYIPDRRIARARGKLIKGRILFKIWIITSRWDKNDILAYAVYNINKHSDMMYSLLGKQTKNIQTKRNKTNRRHFISILWTNDVIEVSTVSPLWLATIVI